MHKLRLIGGPCDGEIIEIRDERPVFQFEEMRFSKERGLYPYKWHTYAIKTVSGTNAVFRVGIHTDLTTQEGFERLFYDTDEARSIRRRAQEPGYNAPPPRDGDSGVP